MHKIHNFLLRKLIIILFCTKLKISFLADKKLSGGMGISFFGVFIAELSNNKNNPLLVPLGGILNLHFCGYIQ